MSVKKAFTLLEMLLVVIIVWLLAGVLFRTYISMSEMSFRVEQEKRLNQELLFSSQILQNLANDYQIDYDKYGTDLNDNNWISTWLYLTWNGIWVFVYWSWNCLSLEDDITNTWCSLWMDKNLESIQITSDDVYITQPLFKIVPYLPSLQYSDENNCNSNYITCIYDPWFWVIFDMYSRWYNDNNWTNRVSIFVQQFFNI